MTEAGEAAVRLASMGIAVFPLKPRGKDPATRHGVKDATTDTEGLAEFFDAHPDCNLGAAMGAASGGVFAIDLDVDEDAGKDGFAALREWELGHGALPDTASAVTGGGGYHLFYRMPGGAAVRNSVNRELGVDVRGDGGYVAVEPSVHPSGRRYEWESPPWETPIAEADANVLAFLEHVRPAKAASDPDGPRLETPESIGEGGRNDALFRAGASMRAKRVDPAVIADALRGINSTRCRPPLPDAEVDVLISSVLALPEGHSEEYERKRQEPKAEAGPADAEPEGDAYGHLLAVGAMDRSGKLVHNNFARLLIEEDRACKIGTSDGAPAVWVGDRYEMGWNAVDRAITVHYDGAKRAQKAEIRDYVRLMAPVRQPSPPNLVAFSNGVLDVETMDFGPIGRDMVIPNVIPHDWVPEAASMDWCPEVDAVIVKIACGDQTTMVNIYEAIGLCMYRSNDFAQAPILIGEGSNGKSTLLKMIKALLGGDNYSTLDLETLGHNDFQVGQLVGKLANIGDDISNEFVKGGVLSVFKKIVSGDDVYTDVKGGQGYHFRPYCTSIFSANEFPKIGDSSEGVMRRLFPIEFNARFSRSDPDFDPHINAKVTTERACQRLAYLGIVGLLSVMEHGGFTPNGAAERMRAEIKVSNDTVLQWLDEEGVTAADMDGTPTVEAHADYSEWCRGSGVAAVSRSKFSRRINSALGMDIASRYDSATKKNVRTFKKRET